MNILFTVVFIVNMYLYIFVVVPFHSLYYEYFIIVKEGGLKMAYVFCSHFDLCFTV